MKKYTWLILITLFATLNCALLIKRVSVSENTCLNHMNDQTSVGIKGKTALLIHGYPEPIYQDGVLYRYFTERGYTVIAPYLFSPEFKYEKDSVKKYIAEKLEGRTPDVIVGLSLGGLIAPQVASDFPKAKLVLVATGPYLRTEIETYNNILGFIGRTQVFKPFYWGIRATPTWLYSVFYKSFNRNKLNADEKNTLEKHIKENWSCVTNIPEGEDVEIINFITSVDNTMLLRSLKNQTIIFAGDGDIMMPGDLSRKLKELIKDSKLVVSSNRSHWEVFDESNYQDLDIFLGK